jgi:pyrimidine operon attenuation protein/uracil phosphoribosyltransferase
MKTQLYLEKDLMERTIRRMAHTIYEQHDDFSHVVFVGILKKGYQLALLLKTIIYEISELDVPTFPLEIRPFRDDEKANKDVPSSSFETAGKTIILIDDVLFTGRSVRAAIDALISLGRPACIKLAVMIDRGHRQLPIRADIVGKNIPTEFHQLVDINFETMTVTLL